MGFTLTQIAAALEAQVLGDGDIVITGVAEPRNAKESELALAMDPKYAAGFSDGNARVALLWDGADWQALGLDGAVCLPRAKAAMPFITRALDRGLNLPNEVHKTAIIDDSAVLGTGVKIGPYTVIGPKVEIGDNVQISSHVSIGYESCVGDASILHPGVRIGHQVRIGNGFIAHNNAVIGADGFSFASTHTESAVENLRDGLRDGRESEALQGTSQWSRVHSLGGVEIGDNVEVGANSAIDRGTIRATKIGNGTKIDNLVHIGHNCEIGDDVLLCGQVGIAGSVRVGDRVVLAGKVGVSDNISIGSDVIAGGGTNIYTNVPAGRAILGSPAVKMETEMAIRREIRRLPRLAESFRALQKSVSNLNQKD